MILCSPVATASPKELCTHQYTPYDPKQSQDSPASRLCPPVEDAYLFAKCTIVCSHSLLTSSKIKGVIIVWNASSSITNTGPLEVLIIKLCHCNVLCFFWFNMLPTWNLTDFGIN